MSAFAEHLKQHASLSRMVRHHRVLPATPPVYAESGEPLHPRLAEALRERGISRLYRHQAATLDAIRRGSDVLQVTPTASGKTLSFACATLEAVLDDPRSRALFIYPTKALAQDQIAGLRDLAGGLGALAPPRFEIYDGDTSPTRRRKIKSDPPEVLITNPDMLHLGILSNHADWQPLLSNLRFVILDELHVYRGIFGAHVHHILARLQRLCAMVGSRPQFIASSATVGNPGGFAETLVGRSFEVVSESGAPGSEREVVFLNPVGVSPYTAAVRVIAEAVNAGKRTIAFTKARRTTELLHSWLVQQQPDLEKKTAPYRAGYLPAERRHIESRLFSGDLMAVLTTSALELGIDVGSLDLCVLVGYPGSLISSWQRIGRVGRGGRAGLVVLIAMPDALDQYVIQHPELFFGQAFENAVLDPWNPLIAGQHLVCAAAEEPLQATEVDGWGPRGRAVTDGLVQDSRLVNSADGTRWFSFSRRPQRGVSPRSAGQPYSIVDRTTGKVMGTVDGTRVYYECHPGAIYLHGGRSFRMLTLDSEQRKVTGEPARVDYYTVVLGQKETAILERTQSSLLGPFPVGLGRLKVTVRISEYQKKRLFDGEPIATYPLQVPPLIFETVGLWIELPPDLPRAFAERDLHFMGGIHATEHAAIGLFPLLAIADRGDVGGISYTGHPQTGGPAIFIYDGVPGGAGLAERGFADLRNHLARTLDLVASCPCAAGCPACIQSPKCGNGNKPLDKAAAVLTLQMLVGEVSLESLGVEPAPRAPDAPVPEFVAATPAVSQGTDADERRRHGIRRAGNVEPRRGARESGSVEVLPAEAGPTRRGGPSFARATEGERRSTARCAPERTLIFDLETQRGAEDVGGWGNTARMGLALGVVYDVQREVFRTYYEDDVDRLLLDLVMADRVVGFNIDRFDLAVLSSYTEWDVGKIRTLDMLAEIHRRLGFRISLQHLSEENLGESKAGSGLQSLRWWREGRIDLIEQYCRKDVEMTSRLFELGQRQHYLLYRDHSERTVRVPVAW